MSGGALVLAQASAWAAVQFDGAVIVVADAGDLAGVSLVAGADIARIVADDGAAARVAGLPGLPLGSQLDFTDPGNSQMLPGL